VNSDDEQHEAVMDGAAEVVAPWILEIESLYISRKLPSLRGAARHAGANENTVFSIAKRRRWAERRKQAETEAANKLAAAIDERAAQEMADSFSALRQDAMALGRIAARALRVHWQQELRRATEAEQAGERYSCVPPPKGALDYVQLAMALEPRAQPGAADGVAVIRQMFEKLQHEEADDGVELFDYEPAALPAAKDGDE